MALHLGDHELLRDDTPFAALLAKPGVDELVELRSARVGFMAFHGGALEEVTDDVAATAAERADASYYAVMQPESDQWHIPSHLVDPSQSPKLAAFVEHVDYAIAIHGFGRPTLMRSVLLGGRNRALAEHVAVRLIPRLHHYEFIVDLDIIPRALRGQHRRNPVNVVRGGGVQIELPPRIRGKSPMWTGWDGPGRVPHTESLIDGLADAARDWHASAPPLS